ncbi:hypothetical protein [Streptomyces sp. NPDC057336]|uniref:hypothetical protein n=1 Tax=Streptomyces sp. NPDC057336 TaxID=3346102 RepID=UPI0036265E53
MTDHASTDTAYQTWTSLQPITRPGDVPITTPIAWMENRRSDHCLALLLSRHAPDRHGPTDALDTDIPAAQQLLHDWADGQHRLYQAEPLSGHRLGLTAAGHQAVLDLIPDH